MSDAGVHILNHEMSPLDTRRLVQTLTRALLDGQDLGPRGHHIRAVGLNLAQLNLEVQRAVEAFPFDPDMRAELDRFAQAIGQLATVASTYRS